MLALLLSLSLLIWIVFNIDAAIGLRKLDTLEKEPALEAGPLLSIIVAARNEENHIKASLSSQLVQSYKNIEWILVNDRSEDRTGEEMEKMARIDDRVKVLHIKELPNGWLGKNHALYMGAQKASGKALLFTDADIHYEKTAIARAMHYFERLQLDHLTVAPNLKGQGFWLQSFVGFFLFGFSYFKRPWTANNPRSKKGTGIGAFNMVSKLAYETFGTHEAIKMRPDDDLQLGMQMKKAGFNQRIATALELIEVNWYGSLKEALVGLEKNTFAGLNYRISMVLLAIFGVFFSHVLPFFTLFMPNLTIFLLSAGNILAIGILYRAIIRKMTRFSPWMFAVFPLTGLIFIFSIVRASYLTFKRGGIVWRGTLYRLSELKNSGRQD